MPTEPQKTGDKTIDEWGKRSAESAEAARIISQTYGIPTYALDDSLTRQTTDAYIQNFESKNRVERAGANAAVTVADYAMALYNAGLTGADALTGGRLSSGSGKASSVYNVANFLQNAGSGLTGQAYSSMRETTNWMGKLALDLEKTGVEQLIDRALGFGAGSLVPMGIRSFGYGAQESENRGESLFQQAKTGLARAAVEVGTEKLSGVGGSWRGTGYGDAFLGKVDKWIASKTGSELLGTLANAFTGEAVEEMLADVLNPIMDRILGIGEATGRGEDRSFMQRLGDFLADVWGDGQLLYDGLLGGLAGMLGGGESQVRYSIGARNLAVDVATYKAAERIAGSNKLKAEFEQLVGVKLTDDENAAITQIALYLTNVGESGSNARTLETDLSAGMTEAQRQQKTEAQQAVVGNAIEREFKKADIELTEQQRADLAQTYTAEAGMRISSYADGLREAYMMGREGTSLDEAKQSSYYGSKIDAAAFEKAWKMGTNSNAETVDKSTEEGHKKLTAALASFGIHTETAVDAYEDGQDVKRYASEMGRASEMAAQGAKLTAEESGKIFPTLSEAQLGKAQEIGTALRTERQNTVKQLSEARAAIRQQAKALTKGASAETLAAADKAIQESGKKLAEQRQYIADMEKYSLKPLRENAETEADKQALAELDQEYAEKKKALQEAEKAHQELVAKRKELEGGKTFQRKKGTVSYDGGSIDGQTVKGVDRENMTRQQKRIAAMVERLADLINIDYVLFDDDGHIGGAYVRGGTVYVNISSGLGAALNKEIAAASLSHELTHFLQEYAPEEYAALRDYVVSAILKKSPAEFDRLLRQQAQWEPGKSNDYLVNELVANTCQTMLLDDKAVTKLARQNMTLAETVADVLENITAKIQEAFESVDTSKGAVFAPVRAVLDEMDGIVERWSDGIAAAVENYNAEQEVSQNTVQNRQNTDSVQYQAWSGGELEQIYKIGVNEERAPHNNRVPKTGRLADQGALSEQSIADSSGKGKTQNQKWDSTGKELTADQQLYFAGSKIRDADGRLKVMYRGGDGDFTVFDRRRVSYSNLYGRGFYFTESKEHAQQYGRARAFYLNITSPLQAGSKTFTQQQVRSYLEAVAEDEDYGLDNYGREATVDSVLRSVWGKDDFGIITDINASCIGDMVAAAELFNEVNGTSFDGIVVPTETVAFRPEQIKLTDNTKPTEREDVRYQMWDDSPIENVSEKLVAVHNVSEEKLLGALKLGGLPMPSIAIVKAKTGHSMYGPISLVFGKDSIDPRADRRNKVYGSDAWTPTGVRIDYQLDSGKLGDFEDRLQELSQKVAGGVFSSASAVRSASIDTTTTHDLETAVEKLAKNETVLAAYAAEHGIDIPPVYQVKTYNSYGNETLQAYIDRIGAEKLAQLHEQFMSGAWDIAPADIAEIKAVLVEKFMSQKGFNSKPISQERAEKRASLIERDDRAIKFIEDAYRMQTDENKTGEEIDRWQTLDAMKERLAREDVKGWVRGAMSGIYQSSGIFNGREMFTPDGRRRTFKQTHDAVTLANIVKNMSRNQEAKGQGAHFGATGIQSITSQDFQSVEEMRQASGRLARLSEEEYSAAVKAVDKKLEALVSDITEANKDNSYLAREIVREAILETARGRRTVAAIQKFFSEETEYRISTEQAETLIGLFHEAANLPTEYFEAKPQRAVGFDEVRAAVIPDNSTDGLRNALSSAGVPTVEYTAGDEDARLRAVQSVPETQFQRWDDGQSEKWAEMREEIEAGGTKGQARVKTPALFFQKWDDTSDDTLEEARGREEAAARLQSENAALHDIIEEMKKLRNRQDNTIAKLQKRLSITKSPEVRESDARKLSRTLLSDYSSRADVKTVAEQIKALGDTILQTETAKLDEDTIKNQARAIAAEIVDAARVEADLQEDALEVYKNAAADIRGTKLSIDADFLGELDEAGGYETFRRRNFGRFTVAKRDSKTREGREGYQSVTEFYDAKQGEYGEAVFPTLKNEGEQLLRLAEILELSGPMEVNPLEQYRGEATEDIANRIVMDAMSGLLRPETPTTMDRQKARREALREQIKALKAENKLADREAAHLYQTIYALSEALDKAESRYITLRKEADYRVAQVQREGRERAIEIKARERERAARNEADLKEHYREIAQAARERRENTATRQKIRRLISDINKRLTHPTEFKHIPKELTRATIDLLELIDDPRAPRTEKGALDAAAKVAELRQVYESYKSNEAYPSVYDATISKMLDKLAQDVRGTTLQDMDEAQLLEVYRALKAMIHVVDSAVKVRIGNEERNAFEMSREMTKETRDIPKAQKGWIKEHGIPAHLRADVAFDRFGGFKKNSTWLQASRLLNEGQLKQTRLKMELGLPFGDLFNDQKALANFTGMDAFGVIDDKRLVDIGLKDEDGDAIPVTHDFMVALYLDLLNEENRRKFIRGGKTVPDFQKFYEGQGGYGIGSKRAVGIAKQLSEAYHELDQAKAEGREQNGGRYVQSVFEGTEIGERVNKAQEQIDALESEGEKYADKVKAKIESLMTNYDKAWMKATQQLMDVDSKRELNRTTMDVYGIEKANTPNYFPIFTDRDFVDAPMETITNDASLENVGFMKERVKSGNPTYAVGTVYAVTKQIDRVAQYCGLMPAIRDFNKVYNKTAAGYTDSLRKAMNEIFGKAGTDYVENLVADLTGSRKAVKDEFGIDAFFGWLRGNLARSTLTLNPRVALAQAASYPTAAAEVGWKALNKALIRGGKNGMPVSRADQELIAKWSPLLWYRMQGYATPELGDIQGSNKYLDRVWRKARFVTGWIQAVDGATVGRLWYAAEYWVQENKPKLQKGTDAYYEAVAEKFNAVVEKTQPNYTTMQRAAIMRNPSSLVKTFTMFMTQRLQNFNIIYDAVGRYQKARADRANGRNGVTSEDVSEARNDVVRAVTSQLAAQAMFVAIKAVVDVLLHDVKKYRDKDTGDITEEAIWAAVLDAYLDALVGSVMLGSELYGIAKAATGHGKWYGLSLSGVDTVTDLIESGINLANSSYDKEDEKKRRTFYKRLMKLGTNLAQALGLPLNNGVKIGEALIYHIADARNGKFLSFEAGFERTAAQKANKLVLALEAGDAEAIEAAKSEFGDEADAMSKLRAVLKDEVTAKTRAAENAEKILLLAGMDKNDAWLIVRSWETGDGGKYTAVKRAVFSGDKTAFQQEVKALEMHGIKEKDVYSNVKSLVRKVYFGEDLSEEETEIVGGKTLSDEQARRMLADYAGMSVNDAVKTVNEWKDTRDFVKKHGAEYEQYGLTVSQAKYYYDRVKNSVNLSQYADQVDRYGMDTVKAYYGESGSEGYQSTGLNIEQYSVYREGYTKCKGTDLDGDGKTDSGSKKA